MASASLCGLGEALTVLPEVFRSESQGGHSAEMVESSAIYHLVGNYAS